MRIKNKYLRNRLFHNKHWKRIRALEHPYSTYMPFQYGFRLYWTHEEQVKSNFESIEKRVRCLDNGSTKYSWEAPSGFRRQLNRERKAKIRVALQKIRNGNHEIEMPKFKRDAAWQYW